MVTPTNPTNPVIAGSPLPPPLFQLPWGTLRNDGTVYLTPQALGFLQALWAGLQGGGGVIDIITILEPGGSSMSSGMVQSLAQQLIDESLPFVYRPVSEPPDHRFGVNFSKPNIATAAPSAIMARSPAGVNWTMPTLLGASFGVVQSAPSADTAFDLQIDGVSVGTATWLAGQTTATFTKTSPSNLRAKHDYLDLVTPANLNGMSGAFGLTIMGVKS